jgi:hypothetical protein
MCCRCGSVHNKHTSSSTDLHGVVLARATVLMVQSGVAMSYAICPENRAVAACGLHMLASMPPPESELSKIHLPGVQLLQDKSSTQRTAPSFSLGVDLRSVSPGPSDASRRSPGPGSCDAPPGVGSKGAPYSPAFSLRGRLEHGGIVAKSTTPGPGTYDPRTGLADGWRALSSSMADSSSSSLPEADGGIGTERPRTRGYTMGGKLPASDE